MRPDTSTTCPGCGLQAPPGHGPTHRYLGASPACWALYGDLLGSGTGSELVVDAYAAQHPGVPGPQAIQSVAVHLLTLFAVLERGAAVAEATTIRRRALRHGQVYAWLPPPVPNGDWTIQDLVTAGPDLANRAERYARGVWASWSAPHGGIIREWFAQYVVRD